MSRTREYRAPNLPCEDAFEIAIEHAAWLIGRGATPYDAFAALGAPAPLRPSWNDVIWLIAKTHSDLETGANNRATAA